MKEAVDALNGQMRAVDSNVTSSNKMISDLMNNAKESLDEVRVLSSF